MTGLLPEAARVRIMEEGLPHRVQKLKLTSTSKVNLDMQAVAKVLGNKKKKYFDKLPWIYKASLTLSQALLYLWL